MRTAAAWLLALPGVAWALLRVLTNDQNVELTALVSFTPYATAGAVLLFVVVLALRRRVPAVVAGLAALVLVVLVAPRALGGPDQGAGPRMTVMTVNTHEADASAEAIARLARSSGADVVSIQELTPDGVAQLDAAGFGSTFPHRVLRPVGGSSGTGLFSRLPLEPAAAPPALGTRATAARATVPGHGVVEVLSVHPVSSRSSEEWSFWRRGMRALPRATRSGRVRVLAGDFNATLDHREMRRLLGSGYRDAAEQAGAGLTPTWPAGRRLPPLVTIDHVLADDRVRVGEVAVHDVPGTDHRAVVAELILPRG